MKIIVYEMQHNKSFTEEPTISCVPFEAKYFEEYKNRYNECFYDMRKSLDIEPNNFLSDYAQIAEKINDIYLLAQNEEIKQYCLNNFTRLFAPKWHK